MSSIIKDSVEYTYKPNLNPEGFSPCFFNQFTIQKRLYLPHNLPGAKSIIRLDSNVRIIESNIIQTPRQNSLSGQILSGLKLITQGNLIYYLTYADNTSISAVRTIPFTVPFTSSIAITEKLRHSCPSVKVFIEDCHSKLISKDLFFISSILLSVAE